MQSIKSLPETICKKLINLRLKSSFSKRGFYPAKMRRIILDTNFILNCIKFKVDVFSELRRVCDFNFKVYVVDRTLEELSKIAGTGKMKDKEAARLAKLLIEKSINVMKTDSKKNVDALILQVAEKSNDFVATQDKELKEKLKEKGVRLIVIRQKGYLAVGE